MAYAALSLSCRPVGAPGWQIAAQYVVAKVVLMTPWGAGLARRVHVCFARGSQES
jgi:hypothetical protein